MTTVTIPKEAAGKKDLVAIPRDFYEAFLGWRETVKEFTPTLRDKKTLARARKDYAAGRYLTLDELEQRLENRRPRKR
ncbi:MAG: hypothetical protein Q8R20_02080 [Nanoarchaeota archaeon]|nr:hypothetical protein [Nanoarchaeota archaeon]